jgi:hypothetical protein
MARQLAAAAFPRAAPMAGTRIGACGINTAHATGDTWGSSVRGDRFVSAMWKAWLIIQNLWLHLHEPNPLKADRQYFRP